MKILAVILARKNSKRLKNKNIKKLAGKPLIVWSIEHIKKIPNIQDILISTDSKKIALIGKKYEILVPWMRPSRLCKDDTSSEEALIHALEWYEKNIEKVDGIILLQPTSPFRNIKDTIRGINLFKKNKKKSVIGVSISKEKIKESYSLCKNYLYKNSQSEKKSIKKPHYFVNGSFYLTSTYNLKKYRSLFVGPLLPLISEFDKSTVDIDTLKDFKYAEFLTKTE